MSCLDNCFICFNLSMRHLNCSSVYLGLETLLLCLIRLLWEQPKDFSLLRYFLPHVRSINQKFIPEAVCHNSNIFRRIGDR